MTDTPDLAALATASRAEVARQMQICNACRYCEGLCAVFPAMELRRDHAGGTADYLANLCHNCGACHYDCQYAPPHPFAVNVPAAMADLREESYARFAWPSGPAMLFRRNGAVVAVLVSVAVAAFLFALAGRGEGGAAGDFYAVMPHGAMVAVFLPVFAFALLAIAMGVRRFWRAAGPLPITLGDLRAAMGDAILLRNLSGGGMGCMTAGERPDPWRRRFHHWTFWGFALCFASTASGTVLHYFADWPAPYPWYAPPKILGVPGGLLLTAGAAGLIAQRARRDPALRMASDARMGAAFTWTLLLLGVTGLALYWLRATPVMGPLLAVHLGTVFAFFLTMPYGKFVHGIYRTAALVRHAHEQRQSRVPEAEAPVETPGRAVNPGAGPARP
ncbi:tricarballylate utilization 4Fe-4S protein TcuB [Jannaschia sp. S6380]|uniref:tricarballylate utilization 4Fe-4S protein TcuB n=1 Tax=Jannaschia sp. S6380 TaxID=2926408 RepID=UPI001FF21CB6|nr:tricarballylate utilization 4Fe-4S protein TcuB [Jannaschia sp. S6380]